jgi:putative ABC transport system substrate-binding protein
MRRRNLVLGLLVVAAMGTAHAQQSGQVHRIAVVHPSHPITELTETSAIPAMAEIFRELRRLRYIEGQNLVIERHSGEGRAAYYPELARDVVRRNPDVILVIGTSLTLDFKATTATIPLVGIFSDPVEVGVVQSLARPGGNLTGVSVDVGIEQWAKRIQLLQQVAPRVTRLGILRSRTTLERYADSEREMSQRTGTAFIGPPLDRPIDESEYRRVFAVLAQSRADGILVTDESENVTNRRAIVALAEKGQLPAIFPYRVFVEDGGLMSYGVDNGDLGRRAAGMVGQILKGAKPGDIPIFQPTKFELAINLKTAKALGLTVPPELLAIADVVIE